MSSISWKIGNMSNRLLTSYDIVGVVGTNKPRQELAPFISLEELISGAGRRCFIKLAERRIG